MRGIVASDFHLHAHPGGGTGPGAKAAADFATMVDTFLAEGPIEIVLSGDIYDLAMAGAQPVAERLATIAAQNVAFHDTLRRVIQAGGSVVFVPGNHDYELSQKDARAWLSEHLPGARVVPWFFRLHGTHVEHGSQYDPDNAHPHPLIPQGDPLGVMLAREILSRLGDLKLLDLNDRTPLVMLWHCVVSYGARTPGLVWRYCRLGAHKLLAPPVLPANFSERVKREESAFAKQHGHGRDEVRALAALSETPTHLHRGRLARRMYLDRMVFAAVAILSAALLRSSLVMLGCVLVAGLLGMYKNRYRGRTRDRLRDAARRIARHGEVSQVVFGHAHAEHDEQSYMNPGSFSFPETRTHRAFVEIDRRGARLRHMQIGGEVVPENARPLQHQQKHSLMPMRAKLCLVAAAVLLSPSLVDARPVDTRGELQADEKATISLFRDASRAVVYITSIAVRRDYFSFDLMEIPQGTGSGFIWDTRGHIVTNYHVIQNASAAEVTLDDQTTLPATLIGAEPDKDIAVLRIDSRGVELKPIRIGTSADLQVGQKVHAIGNPFGLDQSLTTGIISALGREIKSVSGRPITGVVQTDAAINPGNSGGPLLDSAGRLIGMNTAIFSPSGASAGIGFAVPVDTVNRIVEQLLKFGKIVHPTLGIVPAEDQVMKKLGIKGVLVVEVAARSGAAAAGIHPTTRDHWGKVKLGDIIIAIDGKPVASNSELYKALDGRAVGDRVKVTLARDPKAPVTINLQGK